MDKRKCFKNNKSVLFLCSNYKIMEQDIHVIFRPRNAMFIEFQWRIQTFHLLCACVCVCVCVGGHEMRLNAKGTVGSFGGRKFSYLGVFTAIQ